MSYSKKLNSIFKASWDCQAVQSDDRCLTYKEFYELAFSLTKFLESKNKKSGDVIGIKLQNGLEYCIAYLACLIGNYVVVPINLELSKKEQDFIIRMSQPSFLIDEEIDFFNLAHEKCDRPDFKDSVQDYDAIFFTSGTTGNPKGVCHSMESLIENATSFNKMLDLKNDVRMYHVLPMAYMAGFLNTIISPLIAGGCILIGPRFNPSHAMNFWDKAINWEANSIWITPTLASILVKFTRDKNIIKKVGSNMQNIFCGTAPLPEKLRKDFLFLFSQPLQESFGMSEILLVSAQSRKDAKKELNVGSPLPKLKISKRLFDGQEELLINSPWALKYYLIDGNKEYPLEDGYMPTGDIGEIKGDKLYITGRIKDLIIRGGINISPLSIENIILSEGGVDEVAVVGLPHEFWGEEICACIVKKDLEDEESILKKVKNLCENEIADNMQPDKYIIVNDLPKNTNGKILKNVLVKNLL